MLKSLLKCLSLVVILFSSSAFATQSCKMMPHDSKTMSYLFVQIADTVVLKPIDQKQGLYSLTLEKIPPYISYFSDRPNRVTGLLPTHVFLEAWQQKGKNSFGKEAPNANVEGIKLQGLLEEKNVSFSVVLRTPVYDKQKNTLTYAVTLLKAKKSPETLAKLDKPLTLHHAALFIDNMMWCPGCCCG